MLDKIYVEITNVCNLSCSFCPGTSRAPRFMSTDEFERVAAHIAGRVRYVYLHLMGEPTLHPELGDILRICAAYSLTVIITTNGTLTSLPSARAIIDSEAVHKISVSVHSFEANGGEDASQYLASVTDYLSLAAERGIISVFRLWNLDGADAEGENRLNDSITAFLHGRYPGEWKPLRDGAKIAERTYIEWGERFEWPDLSARDRGPVGFCRGVRDHVGVLADGTVVPCCLDHNGDVPLGNIFSDSLDNILYSQRARAIADGFGERRMTEPLCRRCGFARRF